VAARLLIAALCLAVIQGAVLYIRRGREPSEIRRPNVSLAELPTELGPWKGHDTPIDPRLWVAIRAAEVVDRAYENPQGGRLIAEVAAFLSDEIDPPHMPQVCYTKAGWINKSQKDVQLRVGDDETRPARIVTFEQEGQRVHVLYWYQWGQAHVLDAQTMRQERWKLFGQKTWPPLIKVMVQTSLSDFGEAEEQLCGFGELLLGWTKNVQ